MIFQNAIWQYPKIDDNKIKGVMKVYNCSEIVAQLLIERKLDTKEKVDRFLNPTLEDLHDPFLLSDMPLAFERIKLAIERKESIWIYGDYDVDGITSIVILSKYFEYVGHPANFYIPNRQDEGYGISEQGLEWIKSEGGELVITVDCGITAVEQARFASEIGLDLIITDHHECQDVLPDAVAVVNPKRGGYPFDMLAGCGVALKLTQAMLGEAFYSFYPNVIDIAALGTVADIVPLVDENRIITRIGLEYMMHTSNPGIQALISEANLTGKEITSGHIGFVIAPRINASGRIGNPSISVEMLLEDDYFKALEIAKKLSELNSERQAQEREIMEEAENYIQNSIDLDQARILLVIGENWHTGIIGIVASKLSERYSRPTVVLNIDGDSAKGSARSIEGISIYEVLFSFKHLFDKFGGHEQAAGLSLSLENVEILKHSLLEYGIQNIPKYKLVASRRVNGILKPHMVTHQLVDEIESLKPFGVGNPKPQFVFENLKIDDYRLIGKGQNHLKMVVNDGVRVYDALAFNKAESISALRKTDRIHLLLNLEKNNFMGVETIQLLVQDLIKDKMPIKEHLEAKVQNAIYEFYKINQTVSIDSKFTSVDTFDIMFHGACDWPLLVYSLEGLIEFKDYVMRSNITNYTIHFNHLVERERREGYLDVIFMPVEFGGESAFYIDGGRSISSFIPNREDLVYFYKQSAGFKQTTLLVLADKLRMTQCKILFCLDLLNQMNLLNYEIFNSSLQLNFLPKPKNKMDLEQVPLFQSLSREI
ncbi:MAG: single-stranded-DNA-specific exonuclease RecJ [Clostridiales bacterium]|nr:single-stranded-DNA-specific exonuclease RecJ [Clostridiales bacterium]